jgi:hypothetical protein
MPHLRRSSANKADALIVAADPFFFSRRRLIPGTVRPRTGIGHYRRLMEFNLAGDALDLQGRTPYSERMIHGAIYEARPEINAVIHNHAYEVIPFGVTGVPLRPLTFSLLAIWSLLAFRFLSSRRAAGDRIRAIEQRSRPIIHDD